MEKLIKNEKIDILQYELAQTFLSLGIPLRNNLNIPSILTLHDIEGELIDILDKKENKNVIDFTHYMASHLADSLLTLTDIDKNKRIKMYGIPKEKIFVTPIGVDKSLPFNGPNLKEKIIGFVGNQFYPPNQSATIYLIEKIFPLIKINNPNAKVKIIGMCPKALQNLYKNRSDIIFMGEIKDHKDYVKELSTFSIGTCCIDVGTGMNVKVSNYCALGIPVVLTSICQKGYENIQSLQVVELDPVKISKKIDHILNSKKYAKDLGLMNHDLIFEHLSWEKIAINLENALNYAFMHKRNSSSKINIKPIWMLENRLDKNLLEGHYIINS